MIGAFLTSAYSGAALLVILAHAFYFVGKKLFVTREEYTTLKTDHELHKVEDESVMGQLNITLQGLKVSVDKNTEVTEKLGTVFVSIDKRQAVIEERIAHIGS